MEKYRYTQEFQIKYCDADFKEELKVSTALAYLEEVACASAEELGFGYKYVREKNCAFIVTNTCCEFIRPIRVGEIVKAQTWPLQPGFVTFERQYRFFDAQNAITANAVSRWCLLDRETGKILPSKTIDNQDYAAYNTDKVLPNVRWKISSFETEGLRPQFTITIAYSEYDHNMHVNNTRYADYCMNVFSIETLKNKRISRFSISYVKQCKEGETLRFYRKDVAENEYLIQGKNERNETVILAEVVFA
ncbi:MAG: hypothetical protein E7355_00655 [Clostridiales bacterium]|nr:hypothetical protein [Clostridiales bacterium]